MGGCCSSAPVENSPSESNSPITEDKNPNLAQKTDNNNLVHDSGNLFDYDSSKTIRGNNQNMNNSFKPSLLTISENNQINDYDSYEDDYYLEGYKFEGQIGYGGSAEVVRMSKDGVSYAVKIIDLNNNKNKYMENDHTPKEEVVILKQFDHAHVVKFIEFIEDQDRNKLYIVMEYLGGGTIMKCKTFEEKREAFAEALSAVQYIHFQRIAHQDIKPANILRSENGTIKLVDFGSAVFVEEGKSTIPSGLSGTPEFTPPERFTSDFYDPFAGDVWSLGVTLYNMIYEKAPFVGSIFQIQNLIQNSEPEYPANDEFNDAIDLIKLMLKKNPKDRIKVDQIYEHPFIFQASTTSSLRSLFDSSSRIFESLKSMDTMNSMTRISRGSLRSSLKGSTQNVKIKPSKTSVKKLPQKPKRLNQKPQSQLIAVPKPKLISEKQKYNQKHNQKPKSPINKDQKQEAKPNQKIENCDRNNSPNSNKKQEPPNETKNGYYVVNIDSEPSFQDSDDNNNKSPKAVKNQTTERPTSHKGDTNKDQTNAIISQEKAPEKQKDNTKLDKKPGSSKKQSRENIPENRPSNSRKSKHSVQIDQKLSNSIVSNIENASNVQEQKNDSPRKPKDGNSNLRPSSSKPLKPRRQSKQFTPKKE